MCHLLVYSSMYMWETSTSWRTWVEIVRANIFPYWVLNPIYFDNELIRSCLAIEPLESTIACTAHRYLSLYVWHPCFRLCSLFTPHTLQSAVTLLDLSLSRLWMNALCPIDIPVGMPCPAWECPIFGLLISNLLMLHWSFRPLKLIIWILLMFGWKPNLTIDFISATNMMLTRWLWELRNIGLLDDRWY